MQINELVAYSSKEKLTEEKLLEEINDSSSRMLSENMTAMFKEFNRSLKIDSSLLKEAIAKGRGDYVGFNYEYNPSNPRNITVKFPDGRSTIVSSREEAAQVSDEWNQRNRAAAGAASNNDQQSDSDNTNNNRSNQRRQDSEIARKFKRLKSPRSAFMQTWTYALAAAINIDINDIDGRIFSALGIEQPEDADSVQGFDQVLEMYYNLALIGQLSSRTRDRSRTEEEFNALGQDEIDRIQEINFQVYGRIVSTAFGVYLITHYVAICAFFGINPVTGIIKIPVSVAKGLYKGGGFVLNPRKWRKLTSVLRASWSGIAAAAGAVAGAGIGGLATGAITFLVTTAAFWIVEKVLISTGLAQSVVQGLVNLVLIADRKWYTSWVDDVVQFTGGAGAIWVQEQESQVASALGADELANSLLNLRSEVLNDPSLSRSQRAVAKSIPDVDKGTIVAPSSNDTRNQPSSGPSLKDMGFSDG